MNFGIDRFKLEKRNSRKETPELSMLSDSCKVCVWLWGFQCGVAEVLGVLRPCWLLKPFAWHLWQTSRDKQARRVPWVSRHALVHTYSSSPTLLPARNMLRWHSTPNPPRLRSLKGYKVQISSPSLLAGFIHLSIICIYKRCTSIYS